MRYSPKRNRVKKMVLMHNRSERNVVYVIEYKTVDS